jgi:hypothetical protein
MHQVRHKNKTLATLLAFLLGGIGAQRLYLGGLRDRALWAHLSALPCAQPPAPCGPMPTPSTTCYPSSSPV